MFLVSWSLFSRLSRMKDSVSSSCKDWRGRRHPEWRRRRHPEPAEGGAYHRPPPRPTPTRVSPPPPPPTVHALAPWRPGFTFSPASPSSACPRFPAAGRKPPAVGSSQRTAPIPLLADFAQTPARLPSRSHPLPPSAPPPGRAGGAMLGVAS